MPLNSKQQEAANTIDGQLLIVACPGSGKTTTMVHRIHNIIETKHVSPKSIIMMTFSKASADDMRKRFESEYNDRGVIFCTLHSFCFSTLKACRIVGEDSIISEFEKYDLLKKILKELHFASDDGDFIPNMIMDIGNVKKMMITPEEYKQQCCEDHKLFVATYHMYEEVKNHYRKIDFEDMLLLTLKLFQERPKYVEKLRNAYKYIQIDEFQDTSRIQMEILYLLAGPDGNLACVGDDDQCIYSFAGASPDIMLGFTKLYPNAKVINLDSNYRSGEKIIAAAKKVIEHNPGRYSKEFIAGRGTEGSVRIFDSASDKNQEYKQMVSELLRLKVANVDFNQIAILYRTKQQGEVISQLLSDNDFPYHSLEVIPSRYSSFIFKDIIAYHNLVEGNDISRYELFQIVNKPQRFISYDDLRNGLDRKYLRMTAVNIDEKWKRDKRMQTINELFVFLDCLRGKNPEDFLKVFSTCGYERYLESQADFFNTDVNEYFDIIDGYKADIEKYHITDWDTFIKKAKELDFRARSAAKRTDGISISTMHKSKGLEWENVMVVDCVENFCPYVKATSDAEQEEERRLFYVAMTRAKDNLWLFGYRKKTDKKKSGSISRFILDIQEPDEMQPDPKNGNKLREMMKMQKK